MLLAKVHDLLNFFFIMLIQGKLEKALEVIEGPFGKLLQFNNSSDRKRVNLLIQLGQWKKANTTLKRMLKYEYVY